MLRNKLLGRVARSTACPVTVRTWLVRACGAQIGTGVHIFDGGRFMGGSLVIGDRAMIAQEVLLHNHALITIGAHAWIGPRCAIITQTHEIGPSSQRAGATVNAPVSIGEGCWLGANATVLPGVTIGAGCVIAAGAVVTRDCDPDGLYVGIPAVRKRELASGQTSVPHPL